MHIGHNPIFGFKLRSNKWLISHLLHLYY